MAGKQVRKLSGLVYGEGKKDKKFLIALLKLDQFGYHTKNWHPFIFDNSHGCSPKDILKNCKESISGIDYDLVLCFIDLDKLKHDFPTNWQKKKKELETKYSEIEIIWFLDKLEDEMSRVLGTTGLGKSKINSIARSNVNKFLNSNLWKRILDSIREKELELKGLKK